MKGDTTSNGYKWISPKEAEGEIGSLAKPAIVVL
jgi:hypothetical protein